MPRKLGIFTRYQSEILELISTGIGYTEIAEMLASKYGINVTKQNLEKSYKRYLKNCPRKTRKKQPKTRSKKVCAPAAGKEQHTVTKKYMPEALESIFNTPEEVVETLTMRERHVRIKLELEALLDTEAASGRFSAIDITQMRAWIGVLFVLHPDTARAVLKDTFGCDYSAYREAFENALKWISEKNLYSDFQTRALPADEETMLMFMEMKNERRAKQEKERRMAQLRRDMKRDPEAFKSTQLQDPEML